MSNLSKVFHNMIQEAISKMTGAKASGPSGVLAEMSKASGSCGIRILRDLVDVIKSQNSLLTEWRYSYIVNLYKGKGDALICTSYRGLN